MQDQIDHLRRQCLTLELLSCVLHNQLYGTPDKRTAASQQKLQMSAASELSHMEEEIKHLVKRRDGR
ncbi:MAG: hypothetical protein Q8J78_13935 [Moraxellaceae bacterium]|nr:hypothetical protein [Moraxellaceae bacterium]